MKLSHFPNCVAVSLLKQLRRGFFGLGNFVGSHRILTICTTLVLCGIASSGLLKFDLNYDLRDRYAPLGAASREEAEIYEKFFTKDGKHWDAHVMIRSLDGGSMLRMDRFKAAFQIAEFLENNFTIIEEESGEEFRFKNACHPLCNPNKAFRSFYSGYEIMSDRIADNANFDINQIQLDYPFSFIFGTKIDLAPIFFGVERNTSFVNEDYAIRVTPITDVKIIILSFKANFPDKRSQEAIRKWELGVFKHLSDLDHPLINATIFGDNSICSEVSVAGMVVVPYFVLGFGVLLIFSVVSVASSCKYQLFKTPNILAMSLVMIAGVLSPVIASAASFGVIFYLMPTFDSILVVTPFLVLAIGVDDAFLMIHAWQQVKHKDSEPGHRLAVVMAEAGPSILITSLTNALAFAVGASTTTPAIRSFCIATAVAMIVDLFLELTLFAAVLASSERLEKLFRSKSGTLSPPSGFQSRRYSLSSGIIHRPNRIAPALTRLSSLENGPIRAIPTQSSVTVIGKFLERYCKVISSRWATLGAVLFLLCYWTFVGFGTYYMKAELSTEKLFLRSSVLHSAEKARSKYIFDKYHTVTVIVNKAPNFSNPEEYALFQAMLNEFETLPDAIGPNSTRLWLNDYAPYEKELVVNYGESCGMGEQGIAIYDEETDTEEDTEYAPEYAPEDEEYEEYYTDEDEYEDNSTSLKPSVENLDKNDEIPDATEFSSTVDPVDEETDVSTTVRPTTSRASRATTKARPVKDKSATKKQRTKREVTGEFKIKPISYKCLHFFMENDYSFWEPYVHSENLDSEPTVTGFIFSTGYENSTSWSTRLELMQRWRAIAEKYSAQFDTSIWNRDGLYYDQLLTVRSDTLQTVFMTFCCMAVVCYFLIPSLASCVCASLSVASISIGVYGCLSWWSIDLDPFTMGSLIMSIGFSVDYTAHVSYHYFKGSSEEIVHANYQSAAKNGVSNREVNTLNAVNTLRKRLSMIPEEGTISSTVNPAKRLQDAFSAVGWPMIQAGVSTLICIVVLCLVDSYMIEVFRKTVFLVVTLGLIHGLVILPAILAALPSCMIGQGCATKVCPEIALGEERSGVPVAPPVVVVPPISRTDPPSPTILDSGYASPVTPSSRTLSAASLSVPLEVGLADRTKEEVPPAKSRLTRTLSGVPFSMGHPPLSPSKTEKFRNCPENLREPEDI